MARTFDDLTLLTSVQIAGADWFMLRDVDGGDGSGAEKGITLTNLVSAIVSLGFTGGVSTIISSNLTADRAIVSNGSGKVAVSAVTATELGYVSGVTSAIQTQLNAKQASDATLTALAGLTIAANSITVGTGADAFSQLSLGANTFPGRSSSGNVAAKPITDFGLSLVDDADAAAGRSTLGLGTAAVLAAAGASGAATLNSDSKHVDSQTRQYVGTTTFFYSGSLLTGAQRICVVEPDGLLGFVTPVAGEVTLNFTDSVTTGAVASQTFTNGVLTAYTLVP